MGFPYITWWIIYIKNPTAIEMQVNCTIQHRLKFPSVRVCFSTTRSVAGFATLYSWYFAVVHYACAQSGGVFVGSWINNACFAQQIPPDLGRTRYHVVWQRSPFCCIWSFQKVDKGEQNTETCFLNNLYPYKFFGYEFFFCQKCLQY